MYGIIAKTDEMKRGMRLAFERTEGGMKPYFVTSRMYAARFQRREQAEAVAREMEDLNRSLGLTCRVADA